MRNFFDLVGFEYKKIFTRKSTVIALAIVTLITLAIPLGVFFGNTYVDGELFETSYEVMLKERDYARELAERKVDAALLTEAKEAYSKVPLDGNTHYMLIPEYQEYGRPYRVLDNLIHSVYGENGLFMEGVTSEMADNFYQIRHEIVSSQINSLEISDKAKETLLQTDSRIKTPFTFDYMASYDYFFSMFFSTGLFTAFVMAVCLAPMFAGEYGTRTDQLILTSKYGKNKIITAKLFAGITLSATVCLILTAIIYFTGSAVFGFGGANSPLQLWYVMAIYPFTLGQAAVIYIICILFAVILFSAITLLLSSVFKSPFGVIIITSLLLFIPTMISDMPNLILTQIFNLLPPSMMAVWTILLDYTPYELFGLAIPPYIFLPAFAAAASAVMLPFAWRAFKNHQVG
jgi:ABC-type transport system involved in multi-copper enzyme maturation permease subunit